MQAPAQCDRDLVIVPDGLLKILMCATQSHNSCLAGCTDGAGGNPTCLPSDVQPWPELMALILHLWLLLSARSDKDSILVESKGITERKKNST